LNPITLVLLPGLDGTGDLFANILLELPPNLKPVVVAYPSQRFMPYPELLSWLTGIVPKEESFAILAESYGTPLAVKFAATHPRNLIGVILSAGFVSNPVREWGFLPRLLADALFFRLRPPDFALEYLIVGSDAPDSLKLAVRNAVNSVPAEILAARAREVLTCDARQEIAQVNVPLLYLQGTEDRLIGRESLEEIKRLHPQAVAVSLRTPHSLLQSKPREAARVIVEFLETRCRGDRSGVKPADGS
jgi:pimeloyl-ACP methyl ester carboxylesterase